MASMSVQYIIEQIRSLPLPQQVEVAEAVDRLTWTQRWRQICQRIEARARSSPTASEEQIEAAVREVRREKPLSERS